eukprot:Rmarinus@m.969
MSRMLSRASQVIAASRQAFRHSGKLPSNEDLGTLMTAMDHTSPEDYGIPLKAVSPDIMYYPVFVKPTFECGVFILPRNAQIPLHNHPEMVVLTKILYGKLSIVSYDLKDESSRHVGGRGVRRGVVHMDVSSPTAVLFPRQGNLHAVYAHNDTAMLDVLAPPYDYAKGRDCTYYEVYSGKMDAGNTPIDPLEDTTSPIKEELLYLRPCSPTVDVLTAEDYIPPPIEEN